MEELKKKVLRAIECMDNGDPMKDVLDDGLVREAIKLLAEYIKNDVNAKCD